MVEEAERESKINTKTNTLNATNSNDFDSEDAVIFEEPEIKIRPRKRKLAKSVVRSAAKSPPTIPVLGIETYTIKQMKDAYMQPSPRMTQPSPKIVKLPPVKEEKYKEVKALPFFASHRNQ
jgi:hypothetical protein